MSINLSARMFDFRFTNHLIGEIRRPLDIVDDTSNSFLMYLVLV
jgi:hypothetical protein